MIQNLVDNMEFSRRPIDKDNPERGEELMGRVLLIATMALDQSMLSPAKADREQYEQYAKSQLVQCIHQYLYSEFKADLRKIRRSVADIENAFNKSDTMAQCDSLTETKDSLYRLRRKLQGRD